MWKSYTYLLTGGLQDAAGFALHQTAFCKNILDVFAERALSSWACEGPFGEGTCGPVLFTTVCKGSGSGIRPGFESWLSDFKLVTEMF